MKRFLKLSVVPVVAMVLSATAAAFALNAHAAPIRYEAESASCDGTIDSNHSGYSGSGFCNSNNATGAAVQFAINASSAGTATLNIRYANGGSGSRAADIVVNGATAQPASAFEPTGAWSSWATKTVTVPVNAGSNPVRLVATTGDGLANIDYLDFEVASGIAQARHEAEDPPATCDGAIESEHSGFSGAGFCNSTNATGAAAQFTVNAPSSGTATLNIRYANGASGNRAANISVNGGLAAGGVSFDPTGAWNSWATRTVTVQVSGGSNTIRLAATTGDGLANIDYLDFAMGGSTSPPPTTTPPPPTGQWPVPTGQSPVDGTISVGAGQVFDGGMRRYCCIGDGSQEEDQDPMFELASGATLQNIIIGAPAGDGVHCSGPCTLRNVWWEDVGEDAATFRGSGDPSFLVDGGGARFASDKVFQHNGPGTVTIQNFQANDFGTFYRSCGNCSSQQQRDVVVRNVTLTMPGGRVAGVNINYGDTARFTAITVVNDEGRDLVICQKYIGNDDGDEPDQAGTGADGVNCIYSSSDISYR